MNKISMGWNATLESKWQQHGHFSRGHVARVLSSNHNLAKIQLGADELTASIPPEGSQLGVYPVPGDWCVVACPDPKNQSARILDVFERQKRITRKRVGRHSEPQTLAAHVDVGLILTARREDFNWNRIDRYLEPVPFSSSELKQSKDQDIASSLRTV